MNIKFLLFIFLTTMPMAFSQAASCDFLLQNSIRKLSLISMKWEEINSSHPPFEAFAYVYITQNNDAYMRPDKVGGQLAELFGDTSWVSGRRFVAQMTASGDLIGKSVFEDARKKALFMSDSGKDKYLSFLSASDISEDTVKKYIHFLEAHKYMSHASLDVTIFVLYQILDTPSGITPSQLAINFIKEVDSSVTTFNRALQTLIEDGFIKSETSPGDRRFRKYFVTPKAMQLLEEISSTSIE